MANYEQRDGSGVLFRNKKKMEGDKQPDYRGDANVNGELLEIAAWTKTGNGGDFYSLSFKPKQEYTPKQEYAPKQETAVALDDNSDIPF